MEITDAAGPEAAQGTMTPKKRFHLRTPAPPSRAWPKTLLRTLFGILISVQVLGASAELANSDHLGFTVRGKSVASFDLAQMSAQLEARDIHLFDPEYGKEKSYRAFALGDVLRLGLGEDWAKDGQADLIFQARDGYRAVSPVSKVAEGGGFLAFRDLEREGWEPVGRMRANPAPFYIVWTGAEQTTREGFPWPWQLASIELVHFEARYPEVLPKDAGPGTAAFRGFELFKQRCVRCHSINGQGGVVGPDLNAPMSILTYRPVEMVKELIRRPSRYRHTRMPDHADLSDRDLDDLIEYFWQKRREPASRPESKGSKSETVSKPSS